LIRSALQKHFIFSNLSEEQLSAIITVMKLFSFKKQGLIFKQGSVGDFYYIIAQGKVEVQINLNAVATLAPGDSFGEVALMQDSPRTASAVALAKTALWGLSRFEFRQVLERMSFEKYSENIRFIEEFSFFQALTTKQKEKLANCMRFERFSIGAKVVKEGDLGNSMYFIKEGAAVVTKNGLEIRKLFKNEYFGEQALMNNNLRTATITVLESLSCLSLYSDDLKSALGNNLQDIIFLNSQKMAYGNDPVLKGLNPEQINKLASLGKAKKIVKGSHLVVAGKEIKSFFVLLSGRIEGKKQKFKTSDVIGVNCLQGGSFVFGESLAAVEDSEVIEISREEFEKSVEGELESVIERNNIVRVIKDMKIFRSLSSFSLEKLGKMLNLVKYPSGSVIFSENAPGDSFFIIKSGNVEISKKHSVVRHIGRLDYFGERSLLFKTSRSATVKALNEVECWVLTNKQFSSVIDEQMQSRLLERIKIQDISISIKDLIFVKVVTQNSFSTHFLCVNPEDSKLYILKSMQRNRFISDQDQVNLIQSKKLMLLVDHFFMVSLLKTFKDSFRLCMLFQYVPGVPFVDVIDNVKLSLELNARFYTGCLLLIIEYLHNRDIVLRYPTLRSFMIDDQGYPLLVDFSCSKQISGRTYTVIGSFHYLPPEVIIGEGYETAVDLWGLGVCLYYMMFKKYPFGHNESDPMQIYQQILNYRLVFPSNVDPLSKSRHILCELLNKNPVLRGSIEKFKNHPWFIGLNWEMLNNKQIKAPFLPNPTHVDPEVKEALKKMVPVNEIFSSYETGPESYICRLNLNKNWDLEF
jgi:cGMP-dependent protein kinase